MVEGEKKGLLLEIEDLKADIKLLEAELKTVQKAHRYVHVLVLLLTCSFLDRVF